jgi:hypothetical protein
MNEAVCIDAREGPSKWTSTQSYRHHFGAPVAKRDIRTPARAFPARRGCWRQRALSLTAWGGKGRRDRQNVLSPKSSSALCLPRRFTTYETQLTSSFEPLGQEARESRSLLRLAVCA